MIDAYITYLRDVRRMSPNTVESYARDLASLGAFADKKGVQVESLERRDLETFVRQLMSAGLAPRSVARTVACVRGFYSSWRSRRSAIGVRPMISARRAPGQPSQSFSHSRKWTGCSRSRTWRRRAGCATRR